MNIDASRVQTDENLNGGGYSPGEASGIWQDKGGGFDRVGKEYQQPTGRWPANVILSHAEGCKRVGTRKAKGRTINRFTDGAKPFGNGAGHEFEGEKFPDEEVEVWECSEDCPVRMLDEQSEGVSRFFYCAKVSKKEKTCDGTVENKHVTVKPISLMEYLCKLVAPSGSIILDPFVGSGTTLVAGLRCGNQVIGIDFEEENCETTRKRVEFED